MSDEFPALHDGTLRELSWAPSVATARQIKDMALECIAFRALVESLIEELSASRRDGPHHRWCRARSDKGQAQMIFSPSPSDKPPVWSVILPICAAVAGVAAFVVALVWGLL